MRLPFRNHFAQHPLVLAIAVASMVGASPPAYAQYYACKGAISTCPMNVFPIDVFASANVLDIGDSSAAGFSALAGGQ
jgi:hypothetical protein